MSEIFKKQGFIIKLMVMYSSNSFKICNLTAIYTSFKTCIAGLRFEEVTLNLVIWNVLVYI